MPSAKFCRNPFSTKFCRILQKSVESPALRPCVRSRRRPGSQWRLRSGATSRAKHTNLPNVLGWNLHSSIRYIHWKHYWNNSYCIGEDIMSLLRHTDIREHQVLRPPSCAGSWACSERKSWHLLSNTSRNDNEHRHMGDDNQNIVVVKFAEAKDHTNLSWNCFRKPEISGKSLDKQWMSNVCPVWPVTTATT